jgi:hypothetical protein
VGVGPRVGLGLAESKEENKGAPPPLFSSLFHLCSLDLGVESLEEKAKESPDFLRQIFKESLRPALQPQINKGYESLALLEIQCFQHHFQDISSKMSLVDYLIRPTVLYGSEIWGPSLLESDWTSAERVQTILLRASLDASI